MCCSTATQYVESNDLGGERQPARIGGGVADARVDAARGHVRLADAVDHEVDAEEVHLRQAEPRQADLGGAVPQPTSRIRLPGRGFSVSRGTP